MKVNLPILAASACAMLVAIPLAAASATAEKSTAERSAWPPETLSGTISMVLPAKNLVVVQTQDGVPFDLVVTPGTRIESGGQMVGLQDLKQDMNQSVSVHFIPERRGDVARSIQLGG